MTGGEIALMTAGVPVVMTVIGLLMKIANSTGRIEQKIDDHEERIRNLEARRFADRSYNARPDHGRSNTGPR